VSARSMDWTDLKLMIEGIEAGRRRKRFTLQSRVDSQQTRSVAAMGQSPYTDAHASDSYRRPTTRSKHRSMA
jgi:hypothetical protein